MIRKKVSAEFPSLQSRLRRLLYRFVNSDDVITVVIPGATAYEIATACNHPSRRFHFWLNRFHKLKLNP